MQRVDSTFTENQLFDFLDKTFSDYRALFGAQTNPLSNLDVHDNISKALPPNLMSHFPINLGREVVIDPKYWGSHFVLKKMESLLAGDSLKSYLTSDRDLAWKTMFDKAIHENQKTVNYPKDQFDKFKHDFSDWFSFDPYKSEFMKLECINYKDNPILMREILITSQKLKTLIELRAFLGLFDLCLVFSYQMARNMMGKFHSEDLPILVKKGEDNFIFRMLTEKNTPAGAKRILSNFGEGFTGKKYKKNTAPTAVDLFSNNNLFRSFIKKYFFETLEFEPYLLQLFPAQLKGMGFSEYKNESPLVEAMKSKKYFALRTKIQVKRALVIFRAMAPHTILHNKMERHVVATFLNSKLLKPGEKEFSVKNLNDYFYELF